MSDWNETIQKLVAPETPKALTQEDHKIIWLEPACCERGDRSWCEHDPGPCEECGSPSVSYVITTQAAEIASARNDALEEAAKECDQIMHFGPPDINDAEFIGVRIRALKAPPIPTEGAAYGQQ